MIAVVNNKHKRIYELPEKSDGFRVECTGFGLGRGVLPLQLFCLLNFSMPVNRYSAFQ